MSYNEQIHLAWRPEHSESDRAYCAYLAGRFGYDEQRIIEKDELPKEIGSRASHGSLFVRKGGGLDPAK